MALATEPAFTVTKATPKVHTSKAESGNEVGRAFCAECGTPLYTVTRRGHAVLSGEAGGAGRPGPAIRRTCTLYMVDAQPWHLAHEGLPQFPKMPPPLG